MSREKYETILQKYKQSKPDEIENLIFLLGSKDLTMCKALIAWKNTRVVNKFEKEPNVSDEWEYLWEYCMYDKEQFAMLTGISAEDAGKIFERLKKLMLIFPDGTIKSIANSVIKGIIKQNIRKFTGLKDDTKK